MPSGIVVCDGNSLSLGPTQWPALLSASLGGGVTWTNVAVSGQETPTMIANAAANVDALYGTGGGPTNICVAWELSNDIQKGGAPPIHAYERMRRYCGERRSRGWKVVVATMISRVGTPTPALNSVYSSADLETYRVAVNTLVRNSWTAYADALVDLGADSIFGISGGYANATYYNADQIHMVAAGDTRLASLFSPAIAALAT
jgi:hypothetical protein